MANEPIRSTESQKRGTLSLPEATERALLKSLLDKSNSNRTFKDICDCQQDLFGTRASEFRRRVQHRRQYVPSNPSNLQLAVSALLQGESNLDFLIVTRPPFHSGATTSPYTSRSLPTPRTIMADNVKQSSNSVPSFL
jgi:hypothetical protein